uniref:Uncharacterized protein n=1 Tax=Anguilla anguilla TaxID=7936 RepID=A0A0E9WHF1_ANGAN
MQDFQSFTPASHAQTSQTHCSLSVLINDRPLSLKENAEGVKARVWLTCVFVLHRWFQWNSMKISGNGKHIVLNGTFPLSAR